MDPKMPRANKSQPQRQRDQARFEQGQSEHRQHRQGQSDQAQPGPTEQAERLDQRLDAALIETFPASDPIAVGRPTATEPSHRAGDRPAQGAKVRGPSPRIWSKRATAMPAATSAKPSRKVLRARS